jgi:RHS repeat-associated protein
MEPRLVGDPVDTLTGAVFDRKLEFRLIGPLELRWYRHYDSSRHNQSFALGWGHTHDFDRVLRLLGEQIVYQAPVGRVFSFPRLSNDEDECALYGFVLRRLSSRRYLLFRHSEPGMEFEFDKSEGLGRLKRLFKGSHQILFHRDASQRLERIVDSLLRRVSVIEEPNGRLISLTLQGKDGTPDLLLLANKYDQRGNLVATSNGSGHGYAFVYDNANRLVLRTGRKGLKFRFAYDDQGRCIKSTGDNALHSVAIEYKVPGRITKVTNANGGVWTYLFDAFGNLAEVQDPIGGTRKFLRDETGRLTQELDQNLNVTRFQYDRAGEAVAKIDPLGNRISLPEDPNARVSGADRVAANPAEYEYGRLIDVRQIRLPNRVDVESLPLIRETKKLIAVSAEVESAADRSFTVPPLGAQWWPDPEQGRIFNDLGKLVQQRDEFGRLRLWSYDASGNPAEHLDFDGGKWSYDHGSWHFLLGVADPLGAKTRFGYTPSGEVASCLDPGGTLSEYRYDLNDHLIEVRRHGAVRETYKRDAAGNLLAKYAANGRELLRFEIGPGNLRAKRTLASGDEHSFEYDKSGRYLLAVTKKDSAEFGYDALGNRLSDKRNGRGVVYRFQASGQPTQWVFFDRFVTRYDRQEEDILVITDPGVKTHEIRFRCHGLVERKFSNGSQELIQYDRLGRCFLKSTERVDGRIWNRCYEWSGEGELRQVRDNRHGDIRHEYDVAHRLQRRFANGGTEEYQFDAAGNLIRQPGLNEVTLQEGNRLSTVNGLSVRYNDRNHIVERQTAVGQVRYTYDSRDQLIRVDNPYGQWEAEYDALGRRTRKTWAGQTTEFFWSADQLIAEIAPLGRLRLYVYADPLALTPLLFLDYDSVDAAPESCRRYFVFADQIGTPCLIEDEKGTEVWRARIEPFGRAEVVPSANVEFNLRFPGHYFDAELSLHYNRFRYYDPSLGRYLQSDPWGIAGGTNIYAYRANPLLHVDVRGMGEEENPRRPPPEDDEESPHGFSRAAMWRAMAEGADLPRRKARPLTPEEHEIAKDLVAKTRARGDQILASRRLQQGKGPVLAGTIDPMFPNDGPFFGRNNIGPDKHVPTVQTEILKQKLKNYQTAKDLGIVDPSDTAGTPGTHAEFNSLDQALQNREQKLGRPATQSDIDDMITHNYNTQKGTDPETGQTIPAGQGVPPRCDNCRGLTDGMRMVDKDGNLTDEH